MPAGPVPYPHRIRFEDPARHGIVLGHERDYTDLTNWVHVVAPAPAARCVDQIATALVSNAHRHTRSGDPGGTVRVAIHVDAFLLTLRVTDNGPRAGDTIPYPRLGEQRPSPVSGLYLVDQLTVYWDWEWRGTTMGPLTARAVVENP
ncbi:ATP-binding protein [Nocardiopsis sp. NPDC101807]|uniref:ATP-binding protein n=1 Tax=Nocardiopsis sp. NPDC101807 TaxID=3364339 RepID=UPI00381744B8